MDQKAEMKIYLADTIQREFLGHNQEMKIKNHLESYFFILRKKPDWKSWWCVQEKLKEADVSADKQ